MLLHKHIPNEFWAEALYTAAYIRNGVTSKSLEKNTTPFHLRYGKAPYVAHPSRLRLLEVTGVRLVRD